jgi:XrtN system VIT domain protein
VQQRASTDEKVRLFHIGTSFSPYIRSLKERRHFQFECGDAKLLQRVLANGVFVHDVENDNAVIVHSAEAVIAKQTGEQPSNAPDHLMRLFAYNHIMQQLGSRDPQSIDSTVLVREAQEAYVVSPVSSLVVLESQADYDRFDIKDGDNSLKNASMKNKGAVPEPAEWAIIILIAGVLLFFIYKWKMA